MTQIQRQLPLIVQRAVKKNKKWILDLNRSQLIDGLDSEGRDLGEYSPNTIRRKREDPARTLTGMNISLFDTGQFHKDLFLTINDLVLELDNSNAKTGKLTLIFGDDIIGLDKMSVDLLIEKILPDILNDLEKLINGVRYV